MSPRLRFLFAGALTLVAGAFSCERQAEAGGQLVLIINEKNGETPNLSETKRLFLGDVTFWPGNVAVHPIVRQPDSSAGIAFHRAIEVTPSRFKRLWQEKQFSGQGVPPETLLATSAVLARVAGDVGAIGFAMAEEIPAHPTGVRIVVVR